MIDLIEQHYRDNFDRLVATYSKRYGKANGEDIVQEAYTRALTYQHTYKGPCFDSWLSRILHRAVADCLNDQMPEYDELNELIEEDFLVDASTMGIVNELEIAVRSLISDKPLKHQEVLEHLLFTDKTIFQTAKALSLNPNQVWAILRKFKRDLKESGTV